MVAMSPTIKKNMRSRCYDVLVPVPGGFKRGKHRWVSTGATTRRDAEKVVAEAGVDRLILLAQAGALTADAISVVTTGRKFTASDVLEAWEKESSMDISKGSVTTYKVHLVAFFEAIGAMRKPLPGIKRHELDSYINDAECKASTRHTRLAALRSLWRFAQANAYISGNLAETIRVRHNNMTHIQKEKEPAIPLTADEYQCLISSPKVSKFWRRAIILGYWLGIRIGDVARFDVASIGADWVIVWTNKRGKRIKLPLTDPLIGHPDLLQVLAEMKAETPTGYCFPAENETINSKRRHHLSMAAIRLLEKHGIQFKSFHSLRSSAACRWDAAGKTLLEIGELLAHADEETSKIYLQKKPTP
jgi:integrase